MRHVTGRLPLTLGPGDVGNSAPEATENRDGTGSGGEFWPRATFRQLAACTPEGVPAQPL